MLGSTRFAHFSASEDRLPLTADRRLSRASRGDLTETLDDYGGWPSPLWLEGGWTGIG